MITFLEIGELKASGENKTKMVYSFREKLAKVYSKIGDYGRAAEYLGMLREGAESAEQKKEILVQLLGVYLQWPNIELAGALIANYLAVQDIEPGDAIRWLWVEGFHNVVSGLPESGDAGELFFSGPPTAVPGTTFEFTFNEPGVYGYHCHPHEELGMVSSITVVPEPGSIALLAIGAGGLLRFRRNRNRR
ncbi:MAG: PEP-CTERM sorting domain-containing protein [Planctomycetes bacterium]|nr:PEP-CTERM sorting domain-containing protein [Planctomycetota bacterium]